MALTKAQLIDLNANELIIDLDADTSITADTDDQIDIKIAGADDFRFTANTFTALSGSSIVVPASGLTIGSTAVTSTAAELNLHCTAFTALVVFPYPVIKAFIVWLLTLLKEQCDI